MRTKQTVVLVCAGLAVAMCATIKSGIENARGSKLVQSTAQSAMADGQPALAQTSVAAGGASSLNAAAKTEQPTFGTPDYINPTTDDYVDGNFNFGVTIPWSFELADPSQWEEACTCVSSNSPNA